jgi:hypothetical protein
LNGATTALVIDTRPVWESDIAASRLQPAQHPSISYLLAPLQVLRGLPQDLLLRQWSDLKSSHPMRSGVMGLVATSPACVEALQAMPSFSKEISKELGRALRLFAVGEASASHLAAWARPYGEHLQVAAPDEGSGVAAFLKMLESQEGLTIEKATTLFVLLESTTNQPDLSLGLNAKGFRTVRFGLYERSDHSFELPPSVLQSSVVCVIVSSSSLVSQAVKGLVSQGLAPQQAHWFCHHSKIVKALQKADLPFIHQVADFSPERLLKKVVELSRAND